MPYTGHGPYQAEQQEIQRRRQIAQALQAQAFQPRPAGQMVGEHYVRTSPLSSIAQVLQAALASRQLGAATRQEQQLGQRMGQERSQALAQALQMARGSPGSELEPATQGDMPGAAYQLMQSPDPYVSQQGMPLLQLAEAQAGRREALAARTAQAQAAREEQARRDTQAQTAREDLARLTASLRPPPQAAAMTVVSDAQGNQFFVDPRNPSMSAVPVQGPGGSQLAKAVPGAKLPAEIQRMNIALNSLEKGLDAYEAMLQKFDPRSLQQFNPTDRARAASLVADLQMQAKEAQALGALTGPDVEILNRLIADPTSLRGAYYGESGLKEQITEARGSIARRRAGMAVQYGGQAPTEAAPAQTKTIGGKTYIKRDGQWFEQ